jgi:integrase
MPAAPPEPYSVQRFRGGFALVWWETEEGKEPKRRRRTLSAPDRPGAEAEARKLWESSDGTPWTVGRIMPAYLASITEKPSHSRRQDAWKAMKPFWEQAAPDLIDEQMCRSYRSTRRVSDATARYELMQLSTALGWAQGRGHIDHRPRVWLPQAPERKTRHLTQTEFQRFFAAVKAEHARLYVQLGLFTVARPGAILELTWDRVDFMRAQIDFRPPGRAQTAKRRGVVAIGDMLLTSLQEAFKGRTSEYVIERGGQRVKSIKKAFLAASQRSGVHATPYTLRHTGAVWAAESGISMPELAQMMDHDDDRTTQKHYARFSPGHLRGVAEAIESRARGSI